MTLSTAFSVLALSATAAQAYRDTSPFFLYSTSSINIPSIPHVASASSVENAISSLWDSCPTSNYVVALQSGASIKDYLSQDLGFTAPFASKKDSSETIVQVRDVYDVVNSKTIIESIARSCGLTATQYDSSLLGLPELDNNSKAHLLWTELPSLSSDLSDEQKHIVLKNNFEYLSGFVQSIFKGKDFTLVYITHPPSTSSDGSHIVESQEYQAEMPLEGLAHSGELRRSLHTRKEKDSGNQTLIDGPLFDRYQFLSPGIFMGGLVALILLSLLYVAVSALSSLQVTYAAFDKEQGQLAAKKQS